MGHEGWDLSGVLIDMGGVLVSQRPDPAQIAQFLGLDQSVADIAMVDQALWFHRQDYDEGLSTEEFWYRVTGDCGIDVLTDEQIARLVELDVARQRNVEPDALALVHHLRDQGLKVGMVANAPLPIALAVPTFPWARDSFDSLTFSSQVGAPKPSYRIYKQALADIGLPADKVVMIDDRERHLRKADTMGMKTLQWREACQVAGELADHGVVERDVLQPAPVS